MLTRRRAAAVASLGLAAFAPLTLRAQPARQPDGPVALIVGSTPGTGNDILARLMSPFLQARLGQPVVVDNRTGASGMIAAQAVNRAAPDGRTLLVLGDPFVTSPGLTPNLPYDPVAGFSFIVRLASGLVVLAVKPDSPARDLRGFVELARAQPGALSYASPGSGTPHHMIMELFKLTNRLDLLHVPYRGSAQAVQDLIGRRVDAMMLPIHVALPLAKDGQIRILAVGSERRAEEAPEVPTFAEAGFPMQNVTLWYGLFGPPGMPPELIARLNAEVNAWLALPETRERLRSQGMTPDGGTPEAFRAQIVSDIALWGRVIREGNIKAD
ncbi:tripartite tricarboxylate transporter substrate binding protein [Roseomonas sp. OT10]|uniref:Bug family tripartite tricarboxylate transporter substrate binding protein n=1 Tax=Roseomonas cutis TaxID=2897332 RepID=UPI001E5E25E4|nr:tripartite tricarboxylate transporter substrate binding protein [Roseomonas sp. OT10]UFN47879.1 tripartite tricarboxylate transporter substrate binding protein [Roseomonas sp. OT10]